MVEAMNEEAALKARKHPPVSAGIRLTNFYPRYGEANDQVDRITGIYPVSFQRIVPRYRLSTSETRDLGTGPAFDVVPSGISYSRPAAQETRRPLLPHWKGRNVDLLA
jgi:hypothetical protein